MVSEHEAPRALIADDEPEYLEWLQDYLRSKRLTVDTAANVREAVSKISTLHYRVVVIDMSIPPAGSISRETIESNPVVNQYPGLAIAIHARTINYRAPQLIVYTVHDDDAIEQMLATIGATYVLKGKPAEIKNAIDKALNSYLVPKHKTPGRRPQGRRR